MTARAKSRHPRRLGAALAVAVALVALATAPPVGAATRIGETFSPPTGCDAPRTQLQTTSPNSLYSSPSPGVITSWSFLAAADTQPRLKLKLARAAGGDDFTIVGESAVETPAPGVLNTFPTRISVQAGDVIGFHNVSLGRCGEFAPPGYATHLTTPGVDPAPGTTMTFAPGMFHLDVSANLEPDADDDGFGDETRTDASHRRGWPTAVLRTRRSSRARGTRRIKSARPLSSPRPRAGLA